MNYLVLNGKITDEDVKQKPIDLTYTGSRTIDIANAVVRKYDGGICKHKLERSGVAVIDDE